ncbi:hypothetical protein BDA96_02G037700 [Sorghum bicolor]|uniref:Uncharacterized protein n=2 Tax=Sorghum bicolor TaxID=4558 RepID=A0A921QXF6_SORBI|nr:hypothetical protein BDA96_05G053800 [Sorghum bicolor]KAG0541679.1 hypothetical protein BDA96_02G037700 [Sorghum bicolor]KXG27832.1 hypothetical protein SORBI_3005G051300 [Sorghum bicolor]
MEVEPVPCCSATSAERSGAVRARLSSTCRWPGADPAQFPPNSSWTPAVRQESIRPGAPSALLVQQAGSFWFSVVVLVHAPSGVG